MLRRVCLVLSLLLCIACSEDEFVSNKFCTLPARFSYNPVSAVPQLHAACNSMGEWCTIIASNQQFIFSNPTGSTPVNQTALNNYSKPYMGLSGFIVGTPNIPELGYDSPTLTCYDLACRNCYEESSVTKRMELRQGGTAYCPKCARTYDLNNQGLITKGTSGKSLYRYRVYYSDRTNTFTINN